jgi:hypothetical protein
VTPAVALARLQALRAEVASFHTTLGSVYEALRSLGVHEIPAPIGVELGVLLPQNLVGGDLEGLARELNLLNRHLRAFAELCEGTPGRFEVRSLSSDSLDVFLQSPVAVTACVMAAVERLAALYKQILEIRHLRRGLEDRKVPARATTPIAEVEAEMVDEEVKAIGDAIVARYPVRSDRERANELRIAITNALRYLADRIDRGMDLEAWRPQAPSEEGPPAEAPEGGDEGSLAEIREKGGVLRELSRVDQPVLRLPEGRRKEVEGDEPEQEEKEERKRRKKNE